MQRQFATLRRGLEARVRRPGINKRFLGKAYGYLGMWHHAYRYLDEAVVLYETATKLDRGSLKWPYLAGLIHSERGDLQEAERAYRTALGLAPDYVPLLVAMAESAAASGRTEEAVALLERALQVEPGQPRATLRLAQYANSAGRHERAAELLEPMVTGKPGPADFHYTIAQAYRGLGKTELAAAHFTVASLSGGGRVPLVDPILDSVKAVRQDGNAFNVRGQQAFGSGRFDEAIDEFRGAVNAVPDHTSYRINLGMTLLRVGRTAEAEIELRRVLETEPTSPDAHYYLGVLDQGLGKNEAAEQHFAQSLRWDPRHVRSLTRLAALLTESGRGDDAVDYLERSISYDPANSALRVKLGMLLSALGLDEQAVEALRRALPAAPSSHEPRFLLARLLAASPDAAVRDGASSLDMARALFDAQPTLLVGETIAAALAELGEFDRAIAWQQAAADGVRAAGRLDELPWVEARLRLYQSGRPLREPWADGEPEAVTFKVTIEPPNA